MLENRVAVLTGASSGIGRVIALAFGKEGAAAAVNYRRHPEEAEDVVEQVKGAGGRAVAVKADVTEPEDIRALSRFCVIVSRTRSKTRRVRE